MSRVVGVPHSSYELVPPYEALHEGSQIELETLALTEAVRSEAPIRYVVLVPGFQETGASFGRLARRMVRWAYQNHGQQLRAVMYTPPATTYGQAEHTEACMAVADEVWEAGGRDRLNMVGHSRGGRTVFEGCLQLGREDMIDEVWGLTPAGFGTIGPPKNVSEAVHVARAGLREIVGDVALLTPAGRPDVRNIRMLGSMTIHALGNVLAHPVDTLREAHQLSTQVIAAEAALLSRSNLARRVGIVIGRNDVVCLAKLIEESSRGHDFNGVVTPMNITHLGPLLDPEVARRLTGQICGTEDLLAAA